MLSLRNDGDAMKTMESNHSKLKNRDLFEIKKYDPGFTEEPNEELEDLIYAIERGMTDSVIEIATL